MEQDRWAPASISRAFCRVGLLVLMGLAIFSGTRLAASSCSSGSISGGSGFDGFGGSTFYVLPSGGSGTLNVTFNGTGCTWSIASNQAWVTFSPTSGTNSSTSLSIAVSAAANTTSFEEAATISLTVNGSPAGE